MTSAKKLCPSSAAVEGATLIGVVSSRKTVTLLQTPLEIDSKFIDNATQSGPLETRFRFANKCVKNGCKQWTGSRCGVMQTLAAINAKVDSDPVLKACAIRKSCRWFSEEGAKACTVCTFVVTNNLEKANNHS